MIDREFLRGFTKLYALWRGSRKDAYGMAILREMREVGFELSPGTLYPTLAKLQREGDITWRTADRRWKGSEDVPADPERQKGTGGGERAPPLDRTCCVRRLGFCGLLQSNDF